MKRSLYSGCGLSSVLIRKARIVSGEGWKGRMGGNDGGRLELDWLKVCSWRGDGIYVWVYLTLH